MSVVGKAKQKHEGKSGRGDGEYSVVYLVETNNAKDGPIVVGRASGLPQEDVTPYSTGTESDTSSLCRRRSFKQTEDYFWEVTCPFSRSATPRPVAAPPLADDPINRAPVITWSTREVFEAREEDLDGILFQDQAYTPLAPVPEVPVTHAVYTATRNESFFDGSIAFEFTNTVNTVPFKGASIYTCKLSVRATQQFEQTAEGQFFFWQVVYEVEYNPRAWHPKQILNAGPIYLERNEETGEVEKFFAEDDAGQKSTQPVKLDINGAVLPDDKDPIFLVYRIYELKDWTPLRLP